MIPRTFEKNVCADSHSGKMVQHHLSFSFFFLMKKLSLPRKCFILSVSHKHGRCRKASCASNSLGQQSYSGQRGRTRMKWTELWGERWELLLSDARVYWRISFMACAYSRTHSLLKWNFRKLGGSRILNLFREHKKVIKENDSKWHHTSWQQHWKLGNSGMMFSKYWGKHQKWNWMPPFFFTLKKNQ